MNALAHKPATIITVIILLIIALAHLLRLIYHTQVMVSTRIMPAWVSVPVIIIAVGLAYWLWQENRR